MKRKSNWASDLHRQEFECGVNFGLGLFEISISYFPSKVVTLLELVGFRADKTKGMERLLRAARLKDTMR